jgi:hypothetical protein
MMVGMERICSYCKKRLGIKEPIENTAFTHGICPECFAIAVGRWMNLSTAEFLNFFDEPMLAVDSSHRVAAYNRNFLKVLLAGKEKPKDLLWGEFIECRYSKPNWRCGQNLQCNDCPFLRLIHQTFQTSRPQEKISLDLTPISEDGFLKRSWTVSSAKVQDMVHLTFLEAAQAG